MFILRRYFQIIGKNRIFFKKLYFLKGISRVLFLPGMRKN